MTSSVLRMFSLFDKISQLQSLLCMFISGEAFDYSIENAKISISLPRKWKTLLFATWILIPVILFKQYLIFISITLKFHTNFTCINERKKFQYYEIMWNLFFLGFYWCIQRLKVQQIYKMDFKNIGVWLMSLKTHKC